MKKKSLYLLLIAMVFSSFAIARKPTPVLVYIGTYTRTEPHVQGKAEGFYIYEMNPATGALTYVLTSPRTENPSYVAIHPNGKWLYAVNELADGQVSAFVLDQGKKVSLLNTVTSHGNSPCYVSIDKKGKFVMTANYGSGNIALYPINNDGSLKEATSVIQHKGKGPDSRQQGPHAHMIRTGNVSDLIYAVDLGTDRVTTYKLDAAKASLDKVGEYKAKPGAGPRHIEFHKNKKWAYIVNELNGTIESCTVDSQTGALTHFQDISTLPQGETRKAGCADIHITPNGKYLYASNRGEINNIAMYSIDANNGRLTIIGHQSVKGRSPRSFAIDPTGTFLLVANQDTGNIITFKIDASTGKLIDTGIETKVPTPVCVRFD
jgi:6-phosphogluconolactonase